MAQNLPRGTPARLLVLLTLLTGLVAVSAWRDALQRDRAVWLNYPTALGDSALYETGQGSVEVRVGGRVVRLSPATAKTLRRRDDRMFRVGPGLGDGLPFQLYTTQENPGDSADTRLYARTAPGEYIRLHAGVQEGETPPDPAPRNSEKILPPPASADDPFQPGTRPPEEDFPEKNPANKSL